MKTHRNPRRALKSAQEQEGRRRRRNEKRPSPACCRDSGTKEQKVDKAEGEGLCQAHCSTASERQAASHQKSTRERKRMAAETRGERNKVTANTFIGCKLHCCILTLLTHHHDLTKLFVHFYKHNLIKQHDHSCNMKDVYNPHIFMQVVLKAKK